MWKLNSVEDDGAVAGARITGQDEGFLDESATAGAPEPRCVCGSADARLSAATPSGPDAGNAALFSALHLRRTGRGFARRPRRLGVNALW